MTKSRTLAAVLLAAATIFATTSNASAAGSDFISFGAGGIWYRANAIVQTNSNAAWAYAYIEAERNVPAGYMGGRGRLYSSTGTLVKQGNFEYTSSEMMGYTFPSGQASPVSGNFYSQGVVAAWTGAEYLTHNTLRSPMQTAG